MAAKKKSASVFKHLTRREREILEVIHRLKDPTLSEIINEMDAPSVRAAIRTHLNIMEEKGYVTHTKRGREFVYAACQNRDTEAKSLFRSLLANFFDGSFKNALRSHLTDPEAKLNPSEIEEISDLLAEIKAKNQKQRE